MIVLAGPSGAGKSRLAERIGLPVLRLDDFYKSGGDPTLPRIRSGSNAGLVDWDHPDSWLPEDAVAAIERLCADGRTEVPIYDISRDGRCGSQVLDLDGSRYFLAEGMFAQEIVPRCRERGQVAAAYCVTQHPMVTFWRRLTREPMTLAGKPAVRALRTPSFTRSAVRLSEPFSPKNCAESS